jgi:hypothetical protein
LHESLIALLCDACGYTLQTSNINPQKMLEAMVIENQITIRDMSDS